MPAAKDCQTLISYYVKQYKKKIGKEPNVNRWSARWGFDSVLLGMGMEQAMDLVDYYFTTPPTRLYDLDWFFYNYEKLVQAMHEAKTDSEHRRKLMQESKERSERWRNSGKPGIANSERSSKK